MHITPSGRPPFRADHIGSLLRPVALRHAFRDHDDKKTSDTESARLQDEAIRNVLKLQESVGLKMATDGEFRRTSYWARFVSLTSGLAVRDAMFRFHDEHGHEQDFTAPHVIGKVSRAAPI